MMELLRKLLSSKTETEVLEFKEAKSNFSKDKFGQYFSALSNEANLKGNDKAYILLGVKNDRAVVGTNISDKQINDFKLEIGNHTSPRMSFVEVHRQITPNGIVLLFVIPKGPEGQIVSWKGFAYGRDGESLVALHDQERDQIKRQFIEDWSAKILPSANLSDLSPEAILKARKEFINKNPKLAEQVHSWSDIKFLNKSKIAINGSITRAAILLLGKRESEHFINPASSTVTWILKTGIGTTKDYAHFTCPLLLTVDHVYGKVRNLKYRYIPDGSLFPREVDQYDPYIIREALHNCIAHQDYSKGGKITLVEKEDGELIFSNMGDFIPKSVEHVVTTDAPEMRYRNKFLADVMVAYGMIDTVGSGIRKMFEIQRSKFFPLPEYDLRSQKVVVTIIGKVIDLNYARKLAQVPDLTLKEIILLDKVVKKKTISPQEATMLKSKNLIEGRRPSYHISSKVANITGEKERYIKMRGLKDDHYKKMILQYLDKYDKATRGDIDQLLLDILPSVLNSTQRKSKISNILYAMSRKEGLIVNQGTSRQPIWIKNN